MAAEAIAFANADTDCLVKQYFADDQCLDFCQQAASNLSEKMGFRVMHNRDIAGRLHSVSVTLDLYLLEAGTRLDIG